MPKVGAFTFVLHSHLPYTRQAGRWPHGEEWLHEAAAETYVPLLDALQGLMQEGVPARLTLGLTPILVEQLADPDVQRNFVTYLDEKIQHAKDDRVGHLRCYPRLPPLVGSRRVDPPPARRRDSELPPAFWPAAARHLAPRVRVPARIHRRRWAGAPGHRKLLGATRPQALLRRNPYGRGGNACGRSRRGRHRAIRRY